MAKIVFIHDTPRLSGPANSFLKLYKYLKIDHEITVFVPAQGSFTRVLDEKKIPWKVIPSRYKAFPVLIWTIWKGNFDLVYGNNFSILALKALIAAKLLKKPFVWHIREIFNPDMRHPWLAKCLRFADTIIAVSEASALAIQHHLPKQVVHVIHNGVEMQDFAKVRETERAELRSKLGMANEEILVISMGHICARKNQQQAVEAAAKVIKTFPTVKFCFLGMLDHSPDYTKALKEHIDRLGITNNIYLPGFEQNIIVYLRGADIFLHTAIKDPHPRSVLESMATELPVVAYGVDGVSETVVNEKTGYLVPLNNTELLAQRITELITNPTTRTQMGLAGYQRIQEYFTAEMTAQRVNAVITEVLTSKKRFQISNSY